MDYTFTIGTLIEIVVILGSLITAYWKLSMRITIVEQRTGTLEYQAEANEGKLEKRLDDLDKKMDKLIVEVTRIKTKHE